MLADGTHSGSACCWDFGNVTPDPTVYHTMNTLFLGQAYWGRGAGSGPWFMADFEAGVWAGGSNPGEPGWGALSDPAPANEANPSLRVPFAIGFLKTDRDYALRMAERELVAQYQHSQRIFSNAARLLQKASGLSAQQEILRALGEAALEEHGQWILRQRERPATVSESAGFG